MKIIRLTESDIRRLVKKIITENTDQLQIEEFLTEFQELAKNNRLYFYRAEHDGDDGTIRLALSNVPLLPKNKRDEQRLASAKHRLNYCISYDMNEYCIEAAQITNGSATYIGRQGLSGQEWNFPNESENIKVDNLMVFPEMDAGSMNEFIRSAKKFEFSDEDIKKLKNILEKLAKPGEMAKIGEDERDYEDIRSQYKMLYQDKFPNKKLENFKKAYPDAIHYNDTDYFNKFMQWVELDVDTILDKITKVGFKNLTDMETRFLKNQ